MAPKRPRANDAEAPAASKRKRIISGTETSADKSPIAAPKAVKTAKGKESVQPAPPKDNGKAANEPEKVLKSSKKVKSTNKGAEVPAPAEKKTSARPADEQDAIALDPADEENLRKKIKSLAPSKSVGKPGYTHCIQC